MSPFTVFWVGGVLAEVGVVVVCIRRRLFSAFPVFCAYIVWSLLVDVGVYSLRFVSLDTYSLVYTPQMVIDALFQFAVLLELGWSVLRPLRSSLPRRSIFILAFLILVAGAVIWPLAAWTIPNSVRQDSRVLLQLQQTFAVLRVVVFMAMAGFSQVLSIGWRHRELQIATGLGFFSIVNLAVAFIHMHMNPAVPLYDQLNGLVVASYLCTLIYWVVSFSQQEQQRQEFTPQMRSFLLAVTGAARGTRVTLADFEAERKPDNR